jgi:hypothetical protein
VYEGTDDPHITTKTWSWGNDFWYPWPTYDSYTYELHVPGGSVIQEFEVAP